MPDVPVAIQGELRPEWLIKLEEALAMMHEAGWYFSAYDEDFQQLEFQGHPYIWKGQPKMSRWTIDLF